MTTVIPFTEIESSTLIARRAELTAKIAGMQSELGEINKELARRQLEKLGFTIGGLIEIEKKYGYGRPQRTMTQRYRILRTRTTGTLRVTAIRIRKDGTDGRSTLLHSWDLVNAKKVQP